MSQNRAEWSNKLVFILATAGSAIGLGNIWRFPYVAGENGGGAFVLIYIVCLFFIALPIMVAELSIGRASQRSPVMAFKRLAGKAGKYWQVIGWLGIIAAFILISYYSVIGGWTIAYIFEAFKLGQVVLEKETAVTMFEQFTANPWNQVLWTWLFIGCGCGIIIRGIKSGIEAFNKVFIPGLFVMLLILVGNALMCDGCKAGLTFIFYPDFSQVTPNTVLAAVGQAFFSLSVGMGAILTYGSYLSQREDLIKTGSIVAVMLVAVALLASIAIFPVLFTFGLSPEQGPGLTFITLPVAFAKFGSILGPALGALFFLMLFVAALTSVISIIEPVVSHIVDNNIASRVKGTIFVGITAGLLAIPSALSFGGNSFFSSKIFFGKTFFELADFLVADNLLPICGFCMALFVLFVMSRKTRHRQVCWFYNLWKYLLPLAGLSVVIVYFNEINEKYKEHQDPAWFIAGFILITSVCILAYLTRGAGNEVVLDHEIDAPCPGECEQEHEETNTQINETPDQDNHPGK